ncbi:hypothetical protein PMAYCL1PPCAC_11930 [Pristionchus mayeri]|uniref:Protein kinase domain-containing protein n=1 Tax=Pristionchus mayeri TaxID=1317129 RepID=A0AAN5CDW1_9BILA|nr:hypothetical protein PMAYCL1PPCAC_11930 [Pristionchus mayeri]
MAVFTPKTALLELLNGLFTRKINEREPIMANVAGDIELPFGGRYRILGMRAVRDEQTSHDYDVLRVWGKDEGRHPTFGNLAILKIAHSEIDQDDFIQECKLLLAMSDEYPNWRQRRHFIEVLGVGTLKGLFVHGKRCDDEFKEHKLTSPRPFYITERLPITLEDVRFASRNRFVDPQLSIYLAIGMIKGVRLLHEMGWMMREVAPSRFALRLPPSALLFRYVSEISDRVAVTNISWASRYRGDRKAQFSDKFCFNPRYGSPDVVEGISQGPKDDAYSIFFILLEFLLGFLPWDGVNQKESNNAKRVAMVTKTITDKGGPIFTDWCDLFSLVAEADTELGLLPYEKIFEQLIRQTNSNKPDISIIGFLYHLRRQYYDCSAEHKKPSRNRESKNNTKE